MLDGASRKEGCSKAAVVEDGVALGYAAVDEGSYAVSVAVQLVQFITGERRADGEVDMTFVAAEAAKDALRVLAGLLGVGALGAKYEFAGFLRSTGFPLV